MWLGSEGMLLKSDARILSAISYAAEASIYPPQNTAGELTSAQMILISFVYALKHRDLQMIEMLVEASSTVPQINSSFLSVWLRDDFRFPRGDVVTCLSILGKLLLDGLQVPWAVVATLASLDIKYRVQECFLEDDDTAGQLLLSTMNPYVSEGTQAGYDKVLVSKESQTNLTKHVSFKLDVEKISTGSQVELILHDRGISAKPEQSTTGVQTIPEQKPVNDQVLMIGNENGAQCTTKNADWSLLRVQPIHKQKPVNDQVLMIGNENGAQCTTKNADWSLLGVQPIHKDCGISPKPEQSTTGIQIIPEQKPVKDPVLMIGKRNGAQTTPINAEWSLLGGQPVPKQKPVNDQVLMIGNENGAQCTTKNADWSLLGVQPIHNVTGYWQKPVNDQVLMIGNENGAQCTTKNADWSLLGVQPIHKTANDSGLRTSQENENGYQHISVNPFRSIPNNQKKTALTIIDPATGMDILEDYYLGKPIFLKKDPVGTPKTYSDSKYSPNAQEKDRPSSSKASTLPKDPTARVKDGTKTLINRTGSLLRKERPNSKGMANELMYSAILNNDSKSIVTAINAGADVNDEGVMKKRPLHVASSAGRLEPVIELIHWGADVNSLDNWGETPLFVASVAGHLLMAEVLVAAGADINHKNSDGNSPLHVAASAGQLEIVRLLLGSGAELDSRSQWSRTPLHLAASGGHLSVVGLLLDRGADPMAVDATGHTPFSLAKSNQQTLVSEFLLYRSRQ